MERHAPKKDQRILRNLSASREVNISFSAWFAPNQKDIGKPGDSMQWLWAWTRHVSFLLMRLRKLYLPYISEENYRCLATVTCAVWICWVYLSFVFYHFMCVFSSGGPLSALTCCVNVRLLSAIKKISPLIYSQSWVGSWVYTTQAMMTFTLIF